MITGHLSLADMYAKEVLSLVMYSAGEPFISSNSTAIARSHGVAYGCSCRTPSLAEFWVAVLGGL